MTTSHLGISIELERDNFITPLAQKSLSDRYFIDEETSAQQAFARAAVAFSDDLPHAQRIYDYASKFWFMYATPILSNGGTERGMPISCFLGAVGDSRAGLSDHYDENIWLASSGGGIGGYWGHVRSDGQTTANGSRSTGSIPFMHVVDSQMLAFNQGTTRRGSYAAYQDISHPEIDEFIGMRKPTGGDIHRKCLNLHHGVNITDDFMRLLEECIADPSKSDDWSLIDPNSKKVTDKVSAKRLWEKILETRVQTGEPYIHFIDRSNEYLPNTLKEKGLKVNHSNLCVEITLPTSETRTAVCCLSSPNLEKWEEWKDDPLFIEDLIRFLDNVLTYFISKVYSKESLAILDACEDEKELARLQKELAIQKGLRKAAYSAHRERSIGLGSMGFHSLLQSKGIPFESPMALGLTKTIFSRIKDKSVEASKKLAKERGEAPDMIGTGMRHAHLLAIAPNASSADICGGASPSCELFSSNAITRKTLSGTFLHKNKYLETLLKQKEQDTSEVWSSIIKNGGSVDHLDFLDEWEKMVFRTATEVDQHWIVEHAAIRQQYICQSQSLNLFFRPDEEIRYLHDVHFQAWKKGLKTLYYCRSEAIKRAESVSVQTERKRIDVSDEGCISCEG